MQNELRKTKKKQQHPMTSHDSPVDRSPMIGMAQGPSWKGQGPSFDPMEPLLEGPRPSSPWDSYRAPLENPIKNHGKIRVWDLMGSGGQFLTEI